MRWQDAWAWAWAALKAQRLRSLLTIIGFAVGIAAVSLLSALGEGMRQFILQEFTQFGSNIIAINPGKTETFGMGGLLTTTRPLALDDAQLLQSLAQVEQVVPVVFGNGQVKAGTRSRYTDIAGVGSSAAQAWKLKVAQGHFLPDDDLQQPRSFAVLGSKLKTELFGHRNALGETVHIAQSRFRVVGVMQPKGEFLGTDLDDLIYIPAQKALQLFNRDSLMEIDVFYSEHVTTEQIERLVKQTLIDRHGREDFTVITQDAMLASLDKILAIVKLAAAGLGSIALLVGGVSILTIFSITVSERRQEIGLMRAIGFTATQLRNLFLLEALMMAMIGGISGYGLVLFPLLLMRLLRPDFPLAFEPLILVLTLALSAVIGLFAGIKPALDAAKLPPIAALRDE